MKRLQQEYQTSVDSKECQIQRYEVSQKTALQLCPFEREARFKIQDALWLQAYMTGTPLLRNVIEM